MLKSRKRRQKQEFWLFRVKRMWKTEILLKKSSHFLKKSEKEI